jgi:hypothetical protein
MLCGEEEDEGTSMMDGEEWRGQERKWRDREGGDAVKLLQNHHTQRLHFHLGILSAPPGLLAAVGVAASRPRNLGRENRHIIFFPAGFNHILHLGYIGL